MRATGRAVTAVLKPVTDALRELAFAPGSVVVCAVSGGPDSVALLHALAALQSRFDFRVVAAHLNHHLRGAASDADEAFVRELCARLGIGLVVEQARGLDADDPNLEERARDLRHAFLKRTADEFGAAHIALAHQADDQAETVLMRLLRGAGAAGLAAMAPRGPGRLFRPLLAVRRATLLAYLEALGATWVVDQSNAVPRLLRNRVRLQLMPLLERDFGSGVGARLVELADEMRAFDAYLAAAARAELARRCQQGRLRVAGFAALEPILAQALVREFLRQRIGDLRGLSRDHIVAVARLCAGRNPSGRLMLPRGWTLTRDYEFVRLERTGRVVADREPFVVVLKPRGTTRVAPAGFTFEARLLERSTGETEHCPPLASMEALFDADALDGPLSVRNFRPGDRIAPLGMRGTRKVHDLFVDRKLGRERRAHWPLIIDGDRILWIPGVARSRFALVTNATQKLQHLRAIAADDARQVSLPVNQSACYPFK